MRLYFIGGGRAGRALAVRCRELGHEVLGVYHRSADRAARTASATGLPVEHGPRPAPPPEAEWVWLTVPDGAIEDVARGLTLAGPLAPGQVLAHASGALPSAALRTAAPSAHAVVSLHPLRSLTGESGAAALRSAAFFVEGEPEGVAAAQALLAPSGVAPHVIDAAHKTAYHAAAVLASNALVALLSSATRALGQAGIERRDAIAALLPLVEGTVGNLREVGLPAALTGPVSRGDSATVERHVEALRDASPELLAVYVTLSMEAVRLAEEQGSAPAGALARITELLSRERERPPPG